MFRSASLWLLQRASAAFLVVLLGLHIWASNFTSSWVPMVRGGIDLGLLALALFHGLNGIRSIILDFGVGIQARRFLSVSLWMLGFAAFLFGAYGLWPLLFPS